MKVLRVSDDPDQAADQRRRFEREVKVHVSLDHPGIMKILTANVVDDPPWYVMVLGEDSLRAELSPPGPAFERAVEISNGLLAAMTHAHAEGIIHRDLKPDNVISVSGAPVITDFGYGRRINSDTSSTMTRGGLGTEGYASPEQFIEGHEADERADIYALGCIIYELFTARRYAAGARWPDVPGAFRYLLMTATNSDPSRRFASVADMAAAFDLAANGAGLQSLAPADRAVTLAQEISSPGGSTKVVDLVQLLLENTDDAQLFLRVLPYFDRAIINAMVRNAPDHFKEIMVAFDAYAADRHPFTFTDRLATFLCACFAASHDFEVRVLILERLLLLGYEHNRFFVGDRFVETVASIERDPGLANATAGILTRHAYAFGMVRDRLLRSVTNRTILAALG